MITYTFQKRRQADVFVNGIGFIENTICEIFEGESHIGNYVSGYEYAFFAFEDYDCWIDTHKSFFKGTRIKIYNQPNNQIIGGTYNDQEDSLLINERHYYFKRLRHPLQGNLFDIKRWKYSNCVKLAMIGAAGDIIYETGIRTCNARLSECDGEFMISDKSYLLDAFAGFYFLDDQFELLDRD